MAKKRILVVDDEAQILKLLQFLLEDEGYLVVAVASGEEALKEAGIHNFDLAILDITLPGIDGYTTCHCLREQGLGILFLSSHNEDESVIKGLEMGALDYIRKPFNTRELILRVENLLLNRSTTRTRENTLCSELVRLDTASEKLTIDGNEVHLSPTEYLLLKLLMSRDNAVVSFEDIMEGIWGGDEWEGGRQMIKVHIKRLREKIESDPRNPEIIRNQWGRGYIFSSDVHKE